jgi:hypothetical protein
MVVFQTCEVEATVVLKGRDHSENLGINERIILEWILGI